MSKADDIKAQLAALQAEYDAAVAEDNDVEIWVKKGDVETKLRGGHGKSFLDKFMTDLGLGATDDSAGEPADEPEDGDDGEASDEPEDGVTTRPKSYWTKKAG
jgi:hypothetical protein